MFHAQPYEFYLHERARRGLSSAAFFAIVMAVTAPIGFWMLARINRAKCTVTQTHVVAHTFWPVRIDFHDVARLGLCRIPVTGTAAAVSVGTQAMGGSTGLWVCAMTRAGKTKRFATSMYEDSEALVELIAQRVGKPYEHLTAGRFGGVVWPGVALPAIEG